ncbi:MAG: aminotransferase class V-fold PLP-dependent enzyme [Rubrobacteraceae bacterium]
MMLSSKRHLFEVPEDVCYLNCAYMSPQLHSVRAAGEKALALKAQPWRITTPDFFEEPERSRELFARIAGGDADGVAILPSVSYGMAVAAANVPLQEGQNILVLEDQFPSNIYPWREAARRRGANLVTVPRPADYDWTAAILERIDEETALVAVPNCHWTDGSLVDLIPIGERVREVGAALVVDATQSLGAHPLDVSKMKPDFLVSAAYKWLLGPYSLGFMYVGDSYRAGVPVEHNWLAREHSEDFARLVDYRDAYQPGARRYDVGERSNFVLLPMANTAMQQVLDWGVDNISETIGNLTGQIERQAAEHGIRTTPSGRRGRHMIGLQLGPAAPKDLAARLASEDVHVSVRGNSVRVSPHLYNTESDVPRLFEALTKLVGK